MKPSATQKWSASKTSNIQIQMTNAQCIQPLWKSTLPTNRRKPPELQRNVARMFWILLKKYHWLISMVFIHCIDVSCKGWSPYILVQHGKGRAAVALCCCWFVLVVAFWGWTRSFQLVISRIGLWFVWTPKTFFTRVLRAPWALTTWHLPLAELDFCKTGPGCNRVHPRQVHQDLNGAVSIPSRSRGNLDSGLQRGGCPSGDPDEGGDYGGNEGE